MGKANRVIVQAGEVPDLKEQIKKLEADIIALNSRLLSLEQTKNIAYQERDKLVSALSKCFPSYLAKHPNDPNWEKDWMNIVFIDLPAGQVSWHIHDSEMSLFAHLELKNNQWDGHSTEQKYERLSKLISK